MLVCEGASNSQLKYLINTNQVLSRRAFLVSHVVMHHEHVCNVFLLYVIYNKSFYLF